MNFPKGRMRFVRAHDGSVSETGWLELDVKALDLEAVSKIYVDLGEIILKLFQSVEMKD